MFVYRALCICAVSASVLAGCSSSSLGSTPLAGNAASDAVRSIAQSSGYTVLHAFTGAPDGADPYGGVIVDQNLNIFGTTRSGGTSVPPAGGAGTLFELANSGSGYTESILHDFGTDGYYPNAAPTEDTLGDIYATVAGGTKKGASGGVIELSLGSGGYQETALYQFKATQGSAAMSPLLDVTSGSSGPKGQLGYISTLYTLTNKGGTYGFGSIAALSLSLTYTDVYDFQGQAKGDGANPLGALAVDPEDPSLGLYGTTQSGGTSGNGTVFRLSPTSGNVAVLYSFKGGTKDGAAPAGGVAVDSSGNIYGTTQSGGAKNAGVLFKLTKKQDGYTESILHAFGASGDGAAPLAAPSLALKGTMLYGTTSAGGTGGAGTIYAIAENGTKYKVLHSFTSATGATPGYGGLYVGATALYGTTESGGSGGDGVVFSQHI